MQLGLGLSLVRLIRSLGGSVSYTEGPLGSRPVAGVGQLGNLYYAWPPDDVLAVCASDGAGHYYWRRADAPSRGTPLDGSWTATPDPAGHTTAVMSGGVGTLTVAAGFTTPTGAILSVPFASGERWEAQVRLATLTGFDANTALAIEGSDGAGDTLSAVITPQATTVQPSASTGGSLGTGGSGIHTDGTGWGRVRYRDGFLTTYFGNGVGSAVPTTWTRLGAYVVPGTKSFATFQVRLVQNVAAAGLVTLGFDSVTLTALDP